MNMGNLKSYLSGESNSICEALDSMEGFVRPLVKGYKAGNIFVGKTGDVNQDVAVEVRKVGVRGQTVWEVMEAMGLSEDEQKRIVASIYSRVPVEGLLVKVGDMGNGGLSLTWGSDVDAMASGGDVRKLVADDLEMITESDLGGTGVGLELDEAGSDESDMMGRARIYVKYPHTFSRYCKWVLEGVKPE